MSARQYASPTGDAILAVIEQHGPISIANVALRLGRIRSSMGEPLNRLRRQHLVYILEWMPPVGKGQPAPLYVAGQGKDMIKPRRRRHHADARYRDKTRIQRRAYDRRRRGSEPQWATWMDAVL